MLAQWHGTITNRIQNVLEDANIRLASVASDVLGASGRLMLRAIIGGQQRQQRISGFVKGATASQDSGATQSAGGTGYRASSLVAPPLLGTVPVSGKTTGQDGHRDRRRMKYTPEELAQVRALLPAGVPLPRCPPQAAVDYWMDLPGISVVSGSSIVGEIGVDMAQ